MGYLEQSPHVALSPGALMRLAAALETWRHSARRRLSPSCETMNAERAAYLDSSALVKFAVEPAQAERGKI